MRVYYESKLARFLTFIKGFATMMFFGNIITEFDELSEEVINHESIHVIQYWEHTIICAIMTFIISLICSMFVSPWIFLIMLISPFWYYISYGIEYLINLIRFRDSDKAYMNISYEREAYENENDLTYLDRRKIFKR